MILVGGKVLSIERVTGRLKCTSGLRPANLDHECASPAIFAVVEGDGGDTQQTCYCESCLVMRATQEPDFGVKLLVKTLMIVSQIRELLVV